MKFYFDAASGQRISIGSISCSICNEDIWLDEAETIYLKVEDSDIIASHIECGKNEQGN